VKFLNGLSTGIAIASGMLVLAGTFLGHKADGSLSRLGELQQLALQLAVILVGFAVLVGFLNLLVVHTKKIHLKQKGTAYSVILLVSLVITFLLGLLSHFLPTAAILFAHAFRTIQLPIETSLMALLVITLTYASMRLLRRRLNLLSVIFLITALLILAGTAPWPFLGDVPFLSNVVRPFIARLPAVAGARGLLIGVALGTLTTGLRILFGSDRPYRGRNG
jgi:cytochrome bd-type quinol oxidase subunit 2